MINILGNRFGKLVVTSHSHVDKRGEAVWDCLCDCGNERKVLSRNLRIGHTVSCGCKKFRNGALHPCFKGLDGISGFYWTRILGRAKLRKIPFVISIEYALGIFKKQHAKCALSGVDLVFHKNSKDSSGNASLDRIDSSKGYVEGNIQWVDKRVNAMKMDLKDEKFIQWCKTIAEYNL